MPIYEFVCESCGRVAEVMQKVDEPAPGCPECGVGRMARLVSRTSFQLKGGGWYSDLYASKKEKPAPGEKPGAGGEAAAKPAAGAKPAAAEKPAAAPAAPAAAPAGGAASKGG